MVRHAGTRALLVGLAAFALSLPLHAQPAADAGSAEPAGPNVLFLMPAFEPEVQNQLRDALLAQFAQLGATLVFEPATLGTGSLSERVNQIQSLAEKHAAIAAFWIEDQ